MSAEILCLGIGGASSPIAAAAIHDGHAVRPEVDRLLALTPAERLREEDPFTAQWATVAATYFVGGRSRFEFDLNRPPESAVYRVPEDAWGLSVWRRELPDHVAAESLRCYERFYAGVKAQLGCLVEEHGRFALLDLHTYNHRRNGPDGPPASAAENPEVNIGTGSLDRARWGPAVDALIDVLRSYGWDVRENVKFRGGHFSRWIHRTFPAAGCCIAIEFKKFFMDEWTGEADGAQLRTIRTALGETIEPLTRALDA